jgi:hypothetical protein
MKPSAGVRNNAFSAERRRIRASTTITSPSNSARRQLSSAVAGAQQAALVDAGAARWTGGRSRRRR